MSDRSPARQERSSRRNRKNEHAPIPKGVASAQPATTLAAAAFGRVSSSPAARVDPNDVLALQTAAGNNAVSQLIQTKLTVGPAGDRHEQEADRVAEHVLRMPDARISKPANEQVGKSVNQQTSKGVQRQEELEEEELQMKPLAASITPIVQRQEELEEEELQMQPEEDEELQTKPLVQRQKDDSSFEAGSDFEGRLASKRGGGSPLPDGTRQFMEPRFGTDFGNVRVHTGGEAVQMNRDIGAQAFTHGSDVFFGAGKYDPGTMGGKRLLAHELTHVVQQGGGTVRRVQRALPTRKDVIEGWGKKSTKMEGAGKPNWKANLKFGLSLGKTKSTYMQLLNSLDEYHKVVKAAPRDLARKIDALDEIIRLCDAWVEKHITEVEPKTVTRLQAILKLKSEAQEERAGLQTPEDVRKELVHDAQLEAHDRHHREGILLRKCWNRWLETEEGKESDSKEMPPPDAFYDYVTGLENNLDEELLKQLYSHVYGKIGTKADEWIDERKKEKDSAGNTPLIPRITYLREGQGEEGRDQYKLKFAGEKASYVSSNQALDRGQKYIYVMSPGMEFYARREVRETQLEYHHSSFLGGGSIGAAGALSPGHGVLNIDLESGHYHPDMQHMLNAVHGLRKQGVPLEKVIMAPMHGDNAKIYGDLFLKLVRTVQAIPGKLLEKLTSSVEFLKRYGFDKQSIERLLRYFGGFWDEFIEKIRNLKA